MYFCIIVQRVEPLKWHVRSAEGKLDPGGLLFLLIMWWLENYIELGKENKYTEKQIKEYKKYIDFIIELNPEVN